MKNFYVLGDTKIQRDDGRGNFILKIINLGNTEPTQIDGFDATSSTGAQVKPVPKYPNDIDVDFENGIFTFVSSDAFRSPFVRPFTDDIYAFRETVPPSKNRYRLFAEYRFRKGNFSLDQINIVSQSEQVFLDGKRLTRDGARLAQLLRDSGLPPAGLLPEAVEYPEHPWFIGVQYHPELKSRPFEPHPLFRSFIAAAVERSRLV